MAANTPISGSTSTGPQFQALYVTLMPYPGASNSPFFEGANVSKFLERFENMCNDYQMAASKKIRCLPWYCEMFTACHIRSVIGFLGLDWTNICTNLKKEYKNRDIAQQISSCAYLEIFKDKPRTKNAEVLQFYRNYSKISKELQEKEKLDKYTQLRWFLQGLSPFIQSKFINYYNIDLDRNTLSDFAKILKTLTVLLKLEKRWPS